MSEDTAERWLPVVGYEGLYEVSDLGRVRSIERRSPRGRSSIPVHARMLKLSSRDGIYFNVGLWRDGRMETHRVHVLVAAAFVGPRPDGQEVRHLNCSSFDNSAANLAYGSSAQNKADTIAQGRNHWASRTHCGNGHEYTLDNTAIRVRGDATSRVCRECKSRRWAEDKSDPHRRAAKAERDREYYLARKAAANGSPS